MNGGELDYSQLNNIDWNKDTVDRFQEVVDTSTQQFYCGDAEVSKWPPLIFSSIIMHLIICIRMECLPKQSFQRLVVPTYLLISALPPLLLPAVRGSLPLKVEQF